MIRAVLYGTLGCHLCDDAEVLLAPLLPALAAELGGDCEIECVDIADDDALMIRYAERIPVLRRTTDDSELSWPFTADHAYNFLRG